MGLQDIGVYNGVISTYGLLVALLPTENHMEIRPESNEEEELYKNRPES